MIDGSKYYQPSRRVSGAQAIALATMQKRSQSWFSGLIPVNAQRQAGMLLSDLDSSAIRIKF
jgi:hypothetical protein